MTGGVEPDPLGHWSGDAEEQPLSSAVGRHGLTLDMIAIGLSVVGIVPGVVVLNKAATDPTAAP